ncbi:histidine phosphatase family protein [Hamadaea tsunoensis]|uniref:histidine phosphatase family protein n=1 Tax=Hamadaea tsunoensis TaxID=53368 RepID=UPI00040B6B81|nr:histidine phosphatase family protein [Hamadaea tsunoensis]
MTRKVVIVEADGGSRGNPGPAGFGALVRDAATGAVLAERSGGLGVATNNVAEYSGLIAGLQAASELGATEVEVRMDSKLVIEQMAGRWQIKHPALRPLAAQAAALVHAFGTVRYVWVPRERNTSADALANQAMDENAQPRTQNWEPRTDKPTRIVLVRHGQTQLTAERRYSGRGDVPLSATGEEQAQAAAARVAKFGPVAVMLSSPLSRCTRTAEHLAAAFDPPPRVAIVEDLIECDFGRWEGLTFAEVREQDPAQLQAWLASTAAAPPGGESFQQVAQRVRRAMTTLRDAYAGETVVVVSHVSPIKLILRDALGASDALLHRLYLDPAGISVVDVYADGGVAVRTVNETAHLV